MQSLGGGNGELFYLGSPLSSIVLALHSDISECLDGLNYFCILLLLCSLCFIDLHL